MMKKCNNLFVATLSTVLLVLITERTSVHAFVSRTQSVISPTYAAKSSSTKRDAFIGWDALDTLYQTAPYYAAFVTCSVKASAADAVAQTKQAREDHHQPKLQLAASSSTSEEALSNDQDEQPPSFDLLRNLAFIFYGGFYQGMGQTFLYTNVYPLIFGTTPTIMSVVGQASFENFILAPFFCLPCVYTLKALLAGETPLDGISKYIQHISSQHILLRYWSIWFPVQCLNFAVVPEHLRVPFGAVISFFWVCLLSSIAAKDGDETVAASQTNQGEQAQRDPLVSLQETIEQLQYHPAYQQVQQWASPWMAGNSGAARTSSSLPQPAHVRVPVYKPTVSDNSSSGRRLVDAPRYV